MNPDIILDNIDAHSIIVTNLEGEITYYNKGAEKIFGYTSDEMIGKTPAILYPNVDMSSMAEDLAKIFEGKDYIGKWEGKSKEGKTVILDIKTTLLKDNDTPIGFIGFAKDITKEEMLEKKAKTIMEAKIKFKSEFLEQMSHEIRTPLNGIMGMMDIMELTTELSEQQNGYLKTMKNASTQLLNMVNDVLDLSKLEAGRLTLKEEPNNLEKVLNQVVNTNRKTAIDKLLEVTFSAAKIQNVIFDRLRIQQVVTNLLTNAIKFTEKGSIKVYFDLLNETNTDYQLRIGVKDTGTGIPAEDIPRLYVDFEQLENSEEDLKSGKHYGTGIGLNICKKVLLLMGSELEVESQLGIGSDFFFHVQLQKEKADSIEKDHSNGKSLENTNVLIVEDKSVNQKVVSLMLKNLKVNYEIAENGKIALDKLKSKNFDLVLMDIQMPIMDGVTATQIIRKEMQLELPIVALTAKGNREFLIDNGMDDYMAKPVNYETLRQILLKNI